MDPTSIRDNEQKWKFFLSSIKTFKHLPTNNLTITTKSKIRCLATEFANKLLQKKGGTIVITGKQDVLNRYKHLAFSKNQTETPITKGNSPLVKAETWPKSKDESIDNIDEPARKRAPRQLFSDKENTVISESSSDDDNSESLLASYDSTKIQHVDSQDSDFLIQTKIVKTNENVLEKPDAISANSMNPFVKRLDDTNGNKKDTSSKNADVIIPEELQTDTNEHVKETSAQKADTIIPEVPQIDETSSHIEIPVNAITLVSDDVGIHRSRYRDKHTPSKKNDIDKACSKWNVLNIAEYFSFDDCVTEIKMPTMFPLDLDDIYEMVQKDICRRLKIVKGIDLKARKSNFDSELLMQLKSITSTETGSRLVLDALLVPLCSELDLQFEVDKNINCNFLPNCRFDYCIRKGEHIIGCIEAKSVKSLSDSSVAQAVLQLMILQTTLMATETPKVDISDFPVFAIVTDGHRFIYMQLKGSSLGFEHDGGKLRIREVRQESDFKDILRHISFLVEGDQSEDDVILID